MTILIGTSGFSYDHWSDGIFYPPKLPKTKWLEFYSEHFPTVELNVTFYRLPKKEAFIGWYKNSPDNYNFVLKGSRYITHIKRLKDPKDSLKRFFERAVGLKEKLSAVLWQLPPSMHFDIERLAEFIKALGKYRSVRHAFEFRHSSWWCDETFNLLSTNNMTFCHADYLREDTVDIPDELPFHYVRLHGISAARYSGDYPVKVIKKWADKIVGWNQKKKDIYVFFNNDASGYAVKNAMQLMKEIKKLCEH